MLNRISPLNVRSLFPSSLIFRFTSRRALVWNFSVTTEKVMKLLPLVTFALLIYESVAPPVTEKKKKEEKDEDDDVKQQVGFLNCQFPVQFNLTKLSN